jgi:acyl-homoserine lactone synthase
MMRIITSENVDDHAELMEQVWRFRHRQFVERLGWRELASEDGREKDRFDTADAIHLVAEQASKVVGYTRLLRTSGPHLLSDVYPHIMQGQAWPRERDVYEWTRCISDVDADRFGEVQASHLLITGVLEFCLIAGIRGMIVETHPKLVTWMLETGYKVETLNTPQDMKGVPVVPVYIGATQTALDRHHAMFGIAGSVLDIDEGLTNPVSGRGTLRHLPGLAIHDTEPPAYAPDVDFGAMRESSGKHSH